MYVAKRKAALSMRTRMRLPMLALLTAGVAVAAGLSAPSSGEAQPAVQPKASKEPDKAHRVEIRFDGLPGPLAAVSGRTTYKVANLDCIPADHNRAIGGIRLAPEHDIEIDWQRAEDGSQSAIVRERPLLDESYFGLGVCRWELQTITVHFTSARTKFVGGINAEQMRGGVVSTQHYLVRDFQEPPAHIDWVFGQKAGYYLERFGPQFTLRIRPRRID